ncbi:MAG: dethiobiotin synthase [Muribaculaceae bacterium]|nr:dethiobiotin synthase [Muribaculaceae bacterium]
MLNIFISGLEPQTGKTLVASGLAATMQSLSYSTSVYKPIQMNAKSLNGFKSSSDLSFVKRIDSNINTLATYMLSGNESPFVSAYEDKVTVSFESIFNDFRTVSNLTECNIVEGCNSIASPILEKMTEINLIRDLRLPLVLVLNPALTPIERILLGLNYIHANRINLLGVIITQYNESSEKLEQRYFPQILKEYSDVNILGILPEYDDVTNLPPEKLIEDVLNNIKLEEIFRVKIAKLYG